MAGLLSQGYGVSSWNLWPSFGPKACRGPMPPFSSVFMECKDDCSFSMFHLGGGVGVVLGAKAFEAVPTVGTAHMLGDGERGPVPEEFDRVGVPSVAGRA